LLLDPSLEAFGEFNGIKLERPSELGELRRWSFDLLRIATDPESALFAIELSGAGNLPDADGFAASNGRREPPAGRRLL